MRICVNILCVTCVSFFNFVFYALFIFPHPLSFSLLVFENKTSDGDKTFLPAGLPGLRMWEGVRAAVWKSVTSSEEETVSSTGKRALMVSS